MALYIGTNYHPHDWPAERWPVDIALMQQASFTTVRLGTYAGTATSQRRVFTPLRGLIQ